MLSDCDEELRRVRTRAALLVVQYGARFHRKRGLAGCMPGIPWAIRSGILTGSDLICPFLVARPISFHRVEPSRGGSLGLTRRHVLDQMPVQGCPRVRGAGPFRQPRPGGPVRLEPRTALE